MKRLFCINTVLVGVLLILPITRVQAQEKQDYHWIESLIKPELQTALGDAVLFEQLVRAEAEIKEGVQCGGFYEGGQSSKEEMQRLNQQYAGRANEEYQRLFTSAKSRNERAKADYRACFGNQLANYRAVWSEGIGSYEEYVSRRDQLEVDEGYYFIEDIQDYVSVIEQRIVLADQDVVARILSSFDEVEISHDGINWKPARTGDPVLRKSQLRTGSRGRARLQFFDKSWGTGWSLDEILSGGLDPRGPTMINVAPKTRIAIESFLSNINGPDRSHEGYYESAIRVFKGTIRAFTKGWGERSRFSIRTGTSLCGMRGTEVGVSYYPETDIAEYHLDHGDAFVEVGGREVQMRPRTSVTVDAGKVSAPRPLTAATWNAIVASSGDGKPGGPTATGSRVIADQKPEQADFIPERSQPKFINWVANGWPNEADIREGDSNQGPAYARFLAKSVILSLKLDNAEGVDLVSDGNFRSSIKGVAEKEGLKAFHDRTGLRPARNKYRCTQCWSEKQTCEVFVDVWQQKDETLPVLVSLLVQYNTYNGVASVFDMSFVDGGSPVGMDGILGSGDCR